MNLLLACLIAAIIQGVPLHPGAASQESVGALGIQTPRFEKLSNGLRLCVIEDSSLPLVSVQLWFRVGSSFDPPTQPGLTHLAVCALRQAAPGETGQAAAQDYESVSTLRDACYFHSAYSVEGAPPEVAAEALDRALHREAERFAHAASATLKAAQASAAALQKAAPSTPPLDHARLLEAMFPTHPYRYPPGFVGDWAARADDAVLREHLARWFTPTNATLFVMGDIAPEAAIAAMRKHCSSIEWRDTPRRADFDPPPDERPPPAVRGKAPGEVTIAWLTPPFGSFENVTIDVLMQRLCSEIDGPLPRVLTQHGWSAPTWRRQAWRNCGILTLSSRRMIAASAPSASAASVADFARLVEAELERAADATIEVEALNRARASAARGALLQRAAFVPRSVLLAEHELIGGDVLLHEYEVPRGAHASAGDIAFAARLLGATRRVVVDGEPAGPRPAGPSSTAPAGSSAADWRLLEVTGDAGLARSLAGWAARARQERRLGSSATAELLPVAGRGLAWISIGRSDAPIDRGALRRAVGDPARADYLSYHGWELAVDGAPPSLIGSGPSGRLDSLLELAIRDLRAASPPGAAGEWRVRCIGDVSLDELEKAVRAATE